MTVEVIIDGAVLLRRAVANTRDVGDILLRVGQDMSALPLVFVPSTAHEITLRVTP